MSFSREDIIKSRFVDLITRDIPAVGAAEVATTFTLFRRTPTGGVSNIGEKGIRWRQVAVNIPCLFEPVFSDTQDRFLVAPTGPIFADYQSLYTPYLDVQTGDNIRLVYDGKFYLVEGSNYEGSL